MRTNPGLRRSFAVVKNPFFNTNLSVIKVIRMSDTETTIAALRQAVRLAPANLQLVLHFCETLSKLGRLSEAEQEYRLALQETPDEQQLQLGLAKCYFFQGKNSHAMAIIETLESKNRLFPSAKVLQAKLLYRDGSVASAVSQYKNAVEDDPDVRDEEFESLLGIDESNEEAEVIDGRIRIQATQDDDDEDIDAIIERPTITFENVGGMESVKEDIRLKIIYPLEHAEMYAAYGKTVGGGILMYGPPGCGKTHLARATAGTVKASFISIGINDVLDMWIGNSERNMHEIFESARRRAPCVLFFDEVDALGASRSDMKQSAGRHTVNQFLAEMDGAESNNDGLLFIGATNAPWNIDTAFRRPGRFEQVIFVPPPDQQSREEILRIHLQGKPQDAIDIPKVAKKLGEYSGADLKAIVDRAIEAKLQDAIRTGRPTPLTTKDLLNAAKRTNATTREWFASAKNHALYANQGGVYDDILAYLNIKK